jgi:hypothetical protein
VKAGWSGVMPKEVVSQRNEFDIEVRWPFADSVQVGILLPEGLAPYNSYWVSFVREDDLDRLIKVLKRAKRKTFK